MISLGDLFDGGRQAKLSPEESFQRRDEEMLRAAIVIKPILKTEGFRLVKELIESRRREIGSMALEDETKPKDWWKGYHAGVNSLHEMLESIFQEAERVKEELDVESWASERMKTSGGDLSI